MTAVKAGEVEGLLRRGPDPRIAVILVYGPDTGLVAERARLLAERAVDDPSDPFALVKLDGDVLASDPGRLMDEAGTVGLFGGKRAVWVRSGSRNYAPAVDAVLKQEGGDTRIVVEAGDLAKTAPLRVVCERSPRALAIPCYPDDAGTLADLIERTAKGLGFSVRRMTSGAGHDGMAIQRIADDRNGVMDREPLVYRDHLAVEQHDVRGRRLGGQVSESKGEEYGRTQDEMGRAHAVDHLEGRDG